MKQSGNGLARSPGWLKKKKTDLVLIVFPVSKQLKKCGRVLLEKKIAFGEMCESLLLILTANT